MERQGLAVFTAYKDRGVDCVVTRRDFFGTPQRIQVKGSRIYEQDGGGWYQITEESLKSATQVTDFWIFVSVKVGARGRLEPLFLVVPANELVARVSTYTFPSGGRYNLYVARDDPDHKGRTVDTRTKKGDPWPVPPNSPRDYTSYDNNWSQLLAAIGA
jgi:hypothetical protein